MLEKGIRHTSETVVSDANTAIALGSGDMEVFATPAMIALMENAAMKAVADSLPAGSSTVGASIDASHIRPSGKGSVIRAEAVLDAVEGRKLTFSISASDGNGTIGTATHVRYIVDRERFMSKL